MSDTGTDIMCCRFVHVMGENLEYISLRQARVAINEYASSRVAFLFLVSYDEDKAYVSQLSEVNPDLLQYHFGGITNDLSVGQMKPSQIRWNPYPQSFEQYNHSFQIVKNSLMRGDSYLVNLTCATPVDTNLTLPDVYALADARYKLMVANRFVFFSPETFVRIEDRKRIFSYPMKGTIDAMMPAAGKQLMDDEKEAAEHATITDLIRNDLSRIANQVKVNRYRYIDRLETCNGPILQTSTEIEGLLPENAQGRMGDILFSMLPAGSITGAPKKRTMQIISQAETYLRGFYSGVAGIYDGRNLDSCVIIRYVEQDDRGMMIYKSGGGITAKSDARKEYEEMIQKIYIPQ